MDELIFEKKMLPGQTDNAGGREAVRPVKGGGNIARIANAVQCHN